MCDAMLATGIQLEHLNLADNAFGPSAIGGFKHFLASPACHELRYMNLNNGGWGTSSKVSIGW